METLEIYYNWDFAFNFFQTMLLVWIFLELRQLNKKQNEKTT